VSELGAIVGVISDTRSRDGHVQHLVDESYLVPLVRIAGVVTVGIPALGEDTDPDALLEHLDGVLLTGNRSNIEPRLYGAADLGTDEPRDPRRDATVLPLVRRVVRHEIPLLAICRGLQEVNVALGGTLHQDLESAGYIGHRDPHAVSTAEKYAPRHEIEIVDGSLLHGMSGLRRALVNSIHQQGIDQLAPGARANAYARDGLVEAFSLPELPAFNLAVQWHPEWRAEEDSLSRSILTAFGKACAARAARR